MSNAWVIYPRDWDNIAKAVLIPDETTTSYEDVRKGGDPARDLSFGDEPASYQLVGRVTAYQG